MSYFIFFRSKKVIRQSYVSSQRMVLCECVFKAKFLIKKLFFYHNFFLFTFMGAYKYGLNNTIAPK